MDIIYCDTCGVRVPSSEFAASHGNDDKVHCSKCAPRVRRGSASVSAVTHPEKKTPEAKSPALGTPWVKSTAPASGDIKFYFCETCGKRITDRQILEGQGRDKKLKGVFCSDCAVGVNTMEFDAIREADLRKPTRKSGGNGRVPTSGFTSADLGSKANITPAKPIKPAAGHGPAQSALSPGIKPFSAMFAAALTLLGAFVLFSNSHPAKNVAKVENIANVEKGSNTQPTETVQTPLPPRVDAPTVASTLASATTNDPEARASSAFDAVQRFEGLASDDNTGRIERIDAFLTQHGDSIVSGRARALRKELEPTVRPPKSDAEALAKSEYDAMVKKIGALEKGDSTGRLALVDAFLKDYGDSEMAQFAKTLREGIAAIEQFNKTLATVRDLPDQPPPGTKAPDADSTQTKVADADAGTRKLLQHALHALAQSDVPAALRSLTQNQDAPVEARKALKSALEALQRRDGSWREALAKNVGRKIKLETKTGVVEGNVLAADADTLKIDKPLVINGATMGSATVQVAVADLLPASREALAPLPTPSTSDEWMGQVLGALAKQDVESADKALNHCDGHVLQTAVKQLELLEQGAARESKAQALWKKAEDLFAAKNWKAAKPVYESLQHDFGGTTFLTANAAAIQKRLEELDTMLLSSQVVTLDLGGGVKMELMPIPAGEFDMGSNDGESNERPVHKVILSHSFFMGKYLVTQAQYEKVMGKNPCEIKGENLPLDMVNWSDASEFCKKLAKLSGKNVRLPTEAEWEYACRAGTKTKYCSGDNEAALDQVAWYDSNSGGKAHPVGQKKPNAWGLYDMHGSVWQWCQDSYVEDYYSKSAPADPEAPNGRDGVGRGGSRVEAAKDCRATVRRSYWKGAGLFYRLNGFRIVVSASKTH